MNKIADMLDRADLGEARHVGAKLLAVHVRARSQHEGSGVEQRPVGDLADRNAKGALLQWNGDRSLLENLAERPP